MQFSEVGNLTADWELRYTQSGKPVASTNLAINHRRKQGTEWVDDGASFFHLTAWGALAEALPQSGLGKGTRVLVMGDWKQRPYQTREGEKRVSDDVNVRHIGADLHTTSQQPSQADVQPGMAAPVSSPQTWGSGPSAGGWGEGVTPTDTPF